MIECSKCGSENHFDGAAFCKNCGAQLSAKIAVQVAEEPVKLNDTEKIRIAGKSETPGQPVKAETDDFTVEDVSDPAETEAEMQKLRSASGEGGIDKLLSLYGDTEPIEQAQSADANEVESTSLGIESASDFLLRQQASGREPELAPSVEKQESVEAVDKISEIQAKLTPIEDKEPEVKNPMGSFKPKQPKESAMAAEEKDRLLNSLNRSLHHEIPTPSPTPPTAGPAVESARPQIVADETESQEQIADPMQDSVDISPAQEMPPAVPTVPMVQLRGKKIAFPDDVRLLPGDHIYFNDQKYLVRKGAFDKRSWMLGGLLVLVLVVIMIVQSLTAPTPMKASLFGIVTNSETNEVLAGVSVSIPQLNVMTVSDEHGMFKFAGVADGRYDVKFEGGLYEARFFPIVIQNNQSDFIYGTVNPILPQSSVSSVPNRSAAAESTPSESQPEFGSLKIVSNVPTATVSADGKSLGKVSQVFKRMKPGNRTITIHADGYEDVIQVVNIAGGEATELAVNLVEFKSDAPVEYTADDFFDQAEALYAEQKYIEAVGYYTLALAKNSTMVKAYLRRAEAHLQVGKKLNARADYRSAADLYINSAMYAQAIACYDKIIDFQPNASDAFSLRGWAKIAAGNYDEGLTDLQKALNFTPDDPQALFDVGKAYYVTNRYKEAEKLLKKIRKHGDENPEIHGYLALTQLAQGDESDARKSYDAFRKVASSAQVARMSTESGWQRLTALAGN